MPTSVAVANDIQVRDEDSPRLSSELSYFRSCLSLDHARKWLREEKAKGRKVIGLLCWGAPAEIVMASGAIPVRLFGVDEKRGASRARLPRDMCPLAASAFAAAEALASDELLDAVVVPATCDWKRKLADLLAGSVPVSTLDAPSSGSPMFVEADLKRLARELALIIDLPVVARNLRSASATMARADQAFVAFQRLRMRPSCALSGPDALAVEASLLRDDLSHWTEHCRSVVRLLDTTSLPEDENAVESAPRVLLIGSPVVWSESSLAQLVEQAGGRVVSEDFHSRLRLLYAPERHLETRSSFSVLAARWSETCSCSLVGGENEELIFRAIGEFRAEGVIVHTYRTCARLQMGAPRFLRRAEGKGTPCLVVETEGDASDTERLLARIEPFMEMLVWRKRK